MATKPKRKPVKTKKPALRKRTKTKPARKTKPKARPQAKKAKRSVKQPVKRSGKPVAKSTAPTLNVIPPVGGILIGRVEDYFSHVGVMALTLTHPLSVGKKLQILGHTTHLDLTVDSMQTDHQPISEAQKGMGVGIKVSSRVRKRDYVFLLPG